MTKYITVKLTEDQAAQLTLILENNVDVFAPRGDSYSNFLARIIQKLAKAKI